MKIPPALVSRGFYLRFCLVESGQSSALLLVFSPSPRKVVLALVLIHSLLAAQASTEHPAVGERANS